MTTKEGLAMAIELCHHMAQMAETAYLNEQNGKRKYRLELGYDWHRFIDVRGAQCHILRDGKNIVVAFRGTEPKELSDLTADLNAFPDRAQVGGFVHNGFQNELEKVWDPLVAILNQFQEHRSLYICGHSLGGAMATICASRLDPAALYTYGSPRAGTRKFIKSITCPHYRHVNNNDIVPKVPFAFMGYKHQGSLRYINFYGNIRKMSKWQRFKDGWRGRVAAWKNKAPFDGARDHGMANYVKYLGKTNAS